MKSVIALSIVNCALTFQAPFGTTTHYSRESHLDAFAVKAFSDMLKPPERQTTPKISLPEKFIDAVNDNDVDAAMDYFDLDVVFENADFFEPFEGKSQVERYLRLRTEAFDERLQVDSVAVDETESKVGISFITVNQSSGSTRKGMASFDMDEDTGLITNVFVIQESNKSGEANLKTLKIASDIISLSKKQDDVIDSSNVGRPIEASRSLKLPELYFQAWNDRDMKKACSIFSDNVKYDDTAFPSPFEGKEVLEKHLNVCADAFPPSFQFVVDDYVDGGEKALVSWHVENDGDNLPFTRGCSFYRFEQGKIAEGTDIVEPAVFKVGSASIFLESMKNKLTKEPVRLVPIALWCTYMYVVFFSDWFFGLPATALEQRTWEEVRDLSLNFFLVSPILGLPFAPVVHPMLEGTFNLLLSWAALFAGFLSDDREDKPNLIPMLPMVAGMQFLTSAFLLPYVATRSNETKEEVNQESLSTVAQLAESRALGVSLAAVGTGSIFWGIFARAQEFGLWDDRLTSFLQLLSIDRVGSSFLVDLAIFGLFQGWLVDDDLKRRGMGSDSILAKAAKYVPFFGMAAYMTLREPLKSVEQTTADK